MINPILKNTRYFVIYSVAWVFIIIAQLLFFFVNLEIPFGLLIADVIIADSLFAIIGMVIWYPVYYINLEKRAWIAIALNHLAAAVISIFLWLHLSKLFVSFIYPTYYEYEHYVKGSTVWKTSMGVAIYFIQTLIYYLIIYYNNFQDKLTREGELNTLVKESELASLKAQINPHFLFNSLNSVSSLTITNPDKAQEMIIKLSEFLRYSIGKDQKEKTTLKEEIQNVRRYLDIEKTRFDEKFDLELNIHDNCFEKTLPNMITQPLVENAIKHGVYESLNKTWIKIGCTSSVDYLVIVIQNNYDPEGTPKKGTGVGLKNIANRLNLFYNRTDLMFVKREKNVFEVKLIIPQEKPHK